MSLEGVAGEKSFKKRMFIPALLLVVFLCNTFAFFFSIVLIDVSKSFGISVGTASQILATTRFAGLIMSLVMGFLSIRFKQKFLLLTGVAFYAAGALGSSLAPDLTVMTFFQIFLGIGSSMATIMTYALIGTFLPLEKRGWTIGLVWSTIFITNLIVTPLTGVMADMAGWRSFLSWFVFPVGIVSLIVGFLIFPSKTSQLQPPTKHFYLKAFKQILSNKSAIACVLSTMLVSIYACTPIYAPSFYRSIFSVSITTAGLFSAVVGATGIFGGFIAGRFMDRVGRKNLTVLTGLVSGFLVVFFTFIPNLWISVIFWGVSAFFVSMTWAALFGLSLEQVPSYRGTMMSLNHSFRYLGAILGLAVGGLVLNAFANNFQILMVILGSSNLALAIILFLIAMDPCKETRPS
jgi:DHA1 family inner membrane transport protein